MTRGPATHGSAPETVIAAGRLPLEPVVVWVCPRGVVFIGGGP